MLKRQRQPSPPPSRYTVPLVTDPNDDLPASRDLKRQRVAPPALDGMSRGWHSSCGDEDDEEEYPSEDEEGPINATPPDEYGTTNNLLRQLHTLNQHRLLFSPAPAKHGPPSMPRNPPFPQMYEQHSTLQSKLPPRLEPVPGSSSAFLHDQDLADGEEMTQVSKRYEGTNRLLGELFLSRRREIGSSNQPHPL